MIYGVPQLGVDPTTRRVRRLHLEAESFAEELLLTALEHGFDEHGILSAEFELANGKTITLKSTEKQEPTK